MTNFTPAYTGRRYLRKATVAERYDVSIQTVDNMVKNGRLPKPYYHGGVRFPRWLESELDAYDAAMQRSYERTDQERAGDVTRAKTMHAKAKRKAKGEAAATA